MEPYEPSAGDKILYNKGRAFQFTGDVIARDGDRIRVRYKPRYDMPKRTEWLRGRVMIDIFEPSNVRWGNGRYWVTRREGTR